MNTRYKLVIAGIMIGAAGAAPIMLRSGASSQPLRPRLVPAVQLVPHGEGTCAPVLTHAQCTAKYQVKEAR
jgi:hypothetical protein